MNITLSADQELIEQVRRYAEKQNTSLNNLIRTYLRTIGSENNRAARADEFSRPAKKFSGRSPEGFMFDGDDIQPLYSLIIFPVRAAAQ